MKNYIGFVNDHSGSMAGLARAAVLDYNSSINAVKEAATREMLDTVVSVVGIGLNNPEDRNDRSGVLRQVVISNPHVLKPIMTWPTPGGTPLYDGIGNLIELFQSLPDIKKEDVSVLIMITTDGEEAHSSKYSARTLAALIKEVTNTGRWTIVFRVPKHASLNRILELGIERGNIQEWETTVGGMAASTATTTAAVNGYFTARAAGAKATGAFYADASKVDITALTDITKKISLYVVPAADNGMEIRPFILRHRMKHLKGSAFYQLTKTEPKVQHDKLVLVRDRASGKFFGGADARKMIGLPVGQNARLHPGDHKNFDIFIQSNSINRKLVGLTGVAYWDEIGTEFTEADLTYLGEKSPFYKAPTTPAPVNTVVQLPAVPVSNSPTKSPIPVQPRFDYFETREDARRHCNAFGITQVNIINNGRSAANDKRWAVPTALSKKVA